MKISETSWYKKLNRKVNGKDIVKIDAYNHVEGYEEAKELADSIRNIEKFQRRWDTRFLNWVADRFEGTAVRLNKWAVGIRFLNTELPQTMKPVDPVDEFIHSLEAIRIDEYTPEMYLDMKTADYIKTENDKI